MDAHQTSWQAQEGMDGHQTWVAGAGIEKWTPINKSWQAQEGMDAHQ